MALATATSTGRARPWGGGGRGGPVLALLLAAPMLFAAAAGASTGEAAWTTYHGDATRTGNDPEAISPQTPSLAWQSPHLGAPHWNQPLGLGSRVFLAP